MFKSKEKIMHDMYSQDPDTNGQKEQASEFGKSKNIFDKMVDSNQKPA
jgi:hypothetical protein